jgi:hypothetical protein
VTIGGADHEQTACPVDLVRHQHHTEDRSEPSVPIDPSAIPRKTVAVRPRSGPPIHPSPFIST